MVDSDSSYIVLARKYRPLDFSSLIGQEAMVQTFANAFKNNRIHHAYILTGVRGVGKTTTARILARAFNYVDENGAKPTLDLQKEGEHCRAIIEGRHVDVIEMDAASNTGIDNIREIIDSVKYSPVSAPYKIYIIDEVHMLSTAAFNGLLKTLEEPPNHVKFIFATTEIRKVPITILSRCQRFDLRRIAPKIMMEHLSKILEQENIEYKQDALSLIVRAGEGSVRDCLSLLDQAIAHGDGKIEADNITKMLGLADRAKIIDLFETIMRGEAQKALEIVGELHNGGCEAKIILSDLANLTHLVTRFKIVPSIGEDISLTPDEANRLPDISNKLSMRILNRAWQILSFGIEEVGKCTNQFQTLEMVIIRLCYVADLPTPDELIRNISSGENTPKTSEPQGSEGGKGSERGEGSGLNGMKGERGYAHEAHYPSIAHSNAKPKQQIQTKAQENSEQGAIIENFSQIVELAAKKRDLTIKYALENYIRPIRFEVGRLEIELTKDANPNIVARLSERLQKWTGRNWLISVSNNGSNIPTIKEAREQQKQSLLEQAQNDELVKEIMNIFPDAHIVDVKIKDNKQT